MGPIMAKCNYPKWGRHVQSLPLFLLLGSFGFRNFVTAVEAEWIIELIVRDIKNENNFVTRLKLYLAKRWL